MGQKLRLFVGCLSPFRHYRPISYPAAASASIDKFLEYFLPGLPTMFFPIHWLLPHITIVETIGERGMNHAAIIIICARGKNGRAVKS